MKKYGFTLTEMLIALAVIGIVSAILAPALRGLLPNQNKVMIKRAYNITTNVVRDLIDNETIYSPFSGNGTELVYNGFDNLDSVVYNGKTYSGTTKFGELFLDSIGAVKDANTTCNIDVSTKYGSVNTSTTCMSGITKNGITWFITHYNINGINSFITADVNGNNKPNCSQTDTDCNSKTSGFDRFTMEIMNNGEVLVNTKDTWARSSINLNSVVNSND